MSKKKKTYIEETCGHLADIERKTMRSLRKKGHLFINVANDWIDINGAILDAYAEGERESFMLVTFWGLFKEVTWLHLFFVAGNYPLLLSRLRFIWESVFGAYYAETYKPRSRRDRAPGPSADDKVAWLEQQERQLGWRDCIGPTLCKIFPLAAREKKVLDHYHDLWNQLNRYVHPSAYLANRLIGPSTLSATDNFDKEWAAETLGIATHVFDLVWVAVLAFYPKAFDKLVQEGLSAKYPILDMVLENARRG